MNRYKGIDTLKTNSGKRYKSNPIYPSIPTSTNDFYIISSVGDRYDNLALKFYGDSKLWWIIASANNMTKASLVTDPGIQIRIPGNKQEAIQRYNQLNTNR